MTEGEKMIWAAAYVRALYDQGPEYHGSHIDAAESAHAILEDLRQVAGRERIEPPALVRLREMLSS